jgi:hypothetical protein
MSNKLARTTKKLVLKRIVLTFEDGSATMLDPNKVDIVDRVTRKPLFKVEETK